MATFTALNGGEAKTAERPNDSPTSNRSSSEERLEIQPASQGQRGASEGAANHRDQWYTTSPDRPGNYQGTEGSNKRKRSDSGELQHEAGQDEGSAPNSASSDSHDPYSTPQRERDRDREYRSYGDDPRPLREPVEWYGQPSRESPRDEHRDDRGSYEQQNSAGSVPSQTDEQIGEALRRASGPTEPHSGEYSATSPDGDDSLMYGSYTPEQRRDGVIQSDPKKRKRNFSNRTKTGCMTCRKRKKKCDETKPECTNCLRGGFICQGYPNQRGYQKMENKPSAVPLESKDPSYVPPGAYGMPQQAPYVPPVPPPKRDPPMAYRGQPLRIDPPQGRPVLSDDERSASTIPSAASGTSPDGKLSALSYNAANMFPTPISAVSSATTPFQERSQPEKFQRVPPLHDLNRQVDPDSPQQAAPLPQINILYAARPSSPSSAAPPAPQTSSAQVAAQLALSHSQHSQSSSSSSPHKQGTQKEEMLRGRLFYPFDPELVLDRERCGIACSRFNNSMNPIHGISPAERSRLFRAILQPQDPIQLSPTQITPITPAGRAADDVIVEAPFNCDYGYNISIGKNVFIGRNCNIVDPCEVTIGDNVYISPNVSILGASMHTNPEKRNGARSSLTGQAIIIEDDCWIGVAAIILPGMTVGKGSTVAAGALVTEDVPPYTIVGGSPARVMRGIVTATSLA